MTARLELHHEGEILVVQAEDAVLGRRSDCELRVIHPLVSRQHCRFEVRTSGVSLVDLGSANGTYVNGQRLDGSTDLRANDWVRIGTQGPQFQLLRAEVDGEDVSGWDPEAMQETMVSGKPPPSNFTVRVSVGPQARAEPSEFEDRSTPSMLTSEPGRPPSIPVALPLETDSHDIRSSDVFLPPPDSGIADDLGPVLIGENEDDSPWSDGAEDPRDLRTGTPGDRDDETGVHATPPEPEDDETGEFAGLRERETGVAREASTASPPPVAYPPLAHARASPDRTEKPADWPAALPPSVPVTSPPAGKARRPRGRRWGALVSGFLVGLLLALLGIAATAAFTPLGDKLHEFAPGARVIELPEDWR